MCFSWVRLGNAAPPAGPHHRHEAVPFFLHPSLNQQASHLPQTCDLCLLRPPPLRLDIQRSLDCPHFRSRVHPAPSLMRSLCCSFAPQQLLFSLTVFVVPRRFFPLPDELRRPHCIQQWQRRGPEFILVDALQGLVATVLRSYHGTRLMVAASRRVLPVRETWSPFVCSELAHECL